MKKIYSFAFAAVAILSAASCQEELANQPLLNEGGDFTVTATSVVTKTALAEDGFGVVWTPGDKISLINAEGNALVREIYPKMEIDEVLDKLLNPEKKIQKKVMIPTEVAVENYTIKGSQLTLSLKNQYTEMKKSTEVLFRMAAVQTLTQIENISFVSFYLEGSPLLDSDGSAVGWMQAEDFVQNTGSSSFSPILISIFSPSLVYTTPCNAKGIAVH